MFLALMWLSGRGVEDALLDWISIDRSPCAVKLGGLCKVNGLRFDTSNLFAVSAYTPTDCSLDTVKGSFYQIVHNLIRTTRLGDIVISAGVRMLEQISCPRMRQIYEAL